MAGAKVDKRKPLIEQLTNTFTRAQLDELNKYKPDLYWFAGDWEQSA